MGGTHHKGISTAPGVEGVTLTPGPHLQVWLQGIQDKAHGFHVGYASHIESSFWLQFDSLLITSKQRIVFIAMLSSYTHQNKKEIF